MQRATKTPSPLWGGLGWGSTRLRDHAHRNMNDAKRNLFLRTKRIGAGRERALLKTFARHDLALR